MTHEQYIPENKDEKAPINRAPSLDIAIPRDLEGQPALCIYCDLEGVQQTAHAGHHHHEHDAVKTVGVKAELGEDKKKAVLGILERTGCVISGLGWAGVSVLVFSLDWITGHVLDGLLLDFIYVTAGIVAYLQFRAAWRGYTTSVMTYREVNAKVKKQFFVYKDWLMEQIGFKKKVAPAKI